MSSWIDKMKNWSPAAIAAEMTRQQHISMMISLEGAKVANELKEESVKQGLLAAVSKMGDTVAKRAFESMTTWNQM